jgi:hypothetical protein
LDREEVKRVVLRTLWENPDLLLRGALLGKGNEEEGNFELWNAGGEHEGRSVILMVEVIG